MIISLIAAMDKNRVLGQDNAMPWHLPMDLQHFKALTLGKPVIMGRKTFASIGRALPGRHNVVISRNRDFNHDHVSIVHSLDEALASVGQVEEVMVIGGGEIYRQAMPLAERMYLTLIEQAFVGDTYFPAWDESEWRVTRQERHEDQGLVFSFVDMARVHSL